MREDGENYPFSTGGDTIEESRYYLILVRNLDYNDVSELKTVLVEV